MFDDELFLETHLHNLFLEHRPAPHLHNLFLERRPALALFGGSAVPSIDQITQAVPFNVFEQFDWLLRSEPESFV